MNTKVDFFFDKDGQWHDEYELLRSIVIDCGLTEELKWGNPCYTDNGANIVLIHGFKEYCALLFFKGALFNNNDGMLIQQTENVQAARQIRFISVDQIIAQESALKQHIYEAIAVEKAGLKVELKKTMEFIVVDEFQRKLDAMPTLKSAFEKLTPGRQRAYLLHFSQAKQAQTREARIARHIPNILNGKGLND